MSDAGNEPDPQMTRQNGSGADDGLRGHIASAAVRTRNASQDHVSLAVPFRAAERNRRVAASVLAGGVAYRLFLWLLPFSLLVGGLLGLGDPSDIEAAVSGAGLPAAVVTAIGDAARAAESNSWWLLLFGMWLLLWAGYTGAKALQLIHALIWGVPPPRTRPLKSSLVFTATCLVFIAVVALTWWIRDETEVEQLLTAAVMVFPLAGLWLGVSLMLPHRQATWKALIPGALFTAISFQVLHGVIVQFLADKLEKSTSLYGALGIVTTLLFFMYLVGRIIVIAPILNSALYEEVRGQHAESDEPPETPPAAPTSSRGESTVQALAP